MYSVSKSITLRSLIKLRKKRKHLDLRKIAEFNESDGFLLIVKLIVIFTKRCLATVFFIKATEIIVSPYVIV